jgi:hypothetical protein
MMNNDSSRIKSMIMQRWVNPKAGFLILMMGLFMIQHAMAEQRHDYDGIRPGGVRFYLDRDSVSFFRVFSFNHIWARYTSMNPGTLDIDNNSMESKFDIGIRRNRTGMYFSFFDRMLSFVQFGITSHGYTGQKNVPISFLDLHSEYAFVPSKLIIGYGLHSYNGISRMSNYGAPDFLYVDYPVYPYPIVNSFDQSGRQLGIYAKGLLGDFEYRVSWSRPYTLYERESQIIPEGSTIENPNDNYALKGYFNWQFLESDFGLFPWKFMNSVGTRRVFNLGAGFYYHPDAMAESLSEGTKKTHSILLLGFDAFLDYPLTDRSAVTAYLVYYDYDYGPNYLTTRAIINPASGSGMSVANIPQGTGNAQWSHGTGSIIHFETGYLLPELDFMNRHQLQFFAGYTLKNLEGLAVALPHYDAGVNFFVHRHNVKWGLQYSTRPVYTGSTGSGAIGNISSHKGTMIFNTQIDF